MKLTRLTIEGTNVIRLIRQVQAGLAGHHVFVHDPVVVLISERYFERVGSNLQTTLLFCMHSESTCTLEIVSGGGAVTFGITYGAERAQNLRFVTEIEKLCAEFGWNITHEQWGE